MGIKSEKARTFLLNEIESLQRFEEKKKAFLSTIEEIKKENEKLKFEISDLKARFMENEKNLKLQITRIKIEHNDLLEKHLEHLEKYEQFQISKK